MNKRDCYRKFIGKMCSIGAVFILLLVLTGCGHKHTWAEATCIEPKKCSECGEIEGNPLGHDWSVEATCTEPKKCGRCGATDGEALGHDWMEATCTEPKRCKRCDMPEGDPIGHTWVEATCTEPKKCSVCGKTEGKTLEHTFEYTIVTEPTCGEKGLEDGICTVCGEKTSKEIPPTNEHEFGEWTVIEEPQCSSMGKEEATCTKCGYTERQYIERLPHTDDHNLVIVKNPTEYSPGEKATHCKVCGAKVQKMSFYMADIAENFKNMRLGEVGKANGVYIGLSYVKKMSYLPTALGTKVEPNKGYEVIFAFFDLYNSTDYVKTLYLEGITCYADGTQVNEVESSYYSECDDIRELSYVDIDGGTQLITCRNYEVPKDWKVLKFYYDSECVWTVSKDEVSDKKFTFESMYEIGDLNKITEKDSLIYSRDYNIEYKGCEVVSRRHPSWGNCKYVVFKFRIGNTGDTALDTSFMGYNMRGYQGNYYLSDGPDYIFHDKVDGYSNIFDVDSIESHMSANIYVAFRIRSSKGKLSMVYDDGYLSNAYKGTICAEYK